MIICCGEALIDMLPRQLPGGEDVLLPICGGAVFNTAISLGRLGEETGFVSGISTDMFGEQLIEGLKASNVSPQYCVRSDNLSTLAFVKLTNGQAQYVFFDENSAGRMLSVDDLPEFRSAPAAMHFGAISLIPEPCGTAYEALMARHKDTSVISLDPNIRPGFIKDAERHKARIARMIAMSDIVKVSDEDLHWLAGDKDSKAVIKDMLTKGVRVVLLTMGGDGVSVYTERFSFDVPARKVTVVDTVGAGDSFNAGFLAGLSRSGLLEKTKLNGISKEELLSAVSLAVSVAAVTVSRTGANPPWQSEL